MATAVAVEVGDWIMVEIDKFGIKASMASRNTGGNADVSNEKRTPLPVILRISPTTSVQPV